jgi:PIN domain nuclease of toxin-antitoxin system
MEIYVLDTHGLLWFLTQSPKIAPLARQILRDAENSSKQVFIPTIVLAELDNIIRKKGLNLTINEVLQKIINSDGFSIVPFDLGVFQIMLTLPNKIEIHDRIIVATTIYYEAKLITRDEILRDFDQIETVWD